MFSCLVLLTLGILPSAAEEGGQATPPSSTKTASQEGASAEDILRTLRQRRPSNEVIPPGSKKDGGPEGGARPEGLLWPEGSTWIERSGRLEREGDWWRFDEDSARGLAVRLLPNAQLEVMVRTLRGQAENNRFKVSGEITLFEGQSYLIVRSSVRASPSAPERQAASPRTGKDASAESVLEKMQGLTPTEAASVDGSSESAETPSEGAGSSTHLLLDGTPVIRRVGRVTRQGGAWMFVSDSDHPDSADAPMRLLPNQALDMMVKDLQAGGASIYVLSGEATLFFGENYLLPRVATRRVDLGNLRK